MRKKEEEESNYLEHDFQAENVLDNGGKKRKQNTKLNKLYQIAPRKSI